MSAFGTENQAAKPLDDRAKRRPRDLRIALTITIVACPYMPTVKPQRGGGLQTWVSEFRRSERNPRLTGHL